MERPTSLKQSLLIALLLLFILPTTTIRANYEQEVDSLQQLIQSANNKTELIQYYFELANVYNREVQYVDAIPAFKKVIELATQLEDHDMLLSSMRKLGYAHNRRGENEQSLNYFMKGWRMADSLSLKKHEAHMLFSIGDYFRLQHLVEPAIEYLDKAKVIYKELGRRNDWCGKIPFTKAIVYKLSDKNSDKWKGVEIMEELLRGECRDELNEFVLAKLYNNLGSAYVFLDKMEKAEENLMKALEMKKRLNKKRSLAYTYNELSSMYLFQEKYELSIKYAKLAYSIAKTGDNVHMTYDILENLSAATQGAGKYKEAVNYMVSSNQLRDSIQNEDRTQAIAELELKYKTAKKEQALAQQDLQLKLQENRYRNLLLIGALLFLTIGFIFLWYRSQLKNKEIEANNLEKLDQLKTRYFTNISHELRTPLSLVLDPIRQLKNNAPRKDQVSLLSTANYHAQRMHRLVNQMLDLEKLEAGKLKLQASPGKIETTIQEVVTAFRTEANQRKIDLSFQNNTVGTELYFDRDKIEKILYNLLSNAIKFTPSGGNILVSLHQRNQSIEILVKDSGVGIPAEKLPFIFNRFYQVDDTNTRPYEGTGIGLSLSKELTELHQGQLQVKSSVGQGTTMILRLPLGSKHLSPEEIQVSDKTSINIANSTNPISLVGTTRFPSIIDSVKEEKPVLLIIEDNAGLRSYLNDQFMDSYQIIFAENGLKGEALALEHLPDLIISDIMMPGKDGYEVCQTLKKDERSSHIPIILLTAKSTQEEKIQGLELQADDYLSKPFDSHELRLRMKNILEQRRLLQLKYAQIGSPEYRSTTSDINTKDETFLQKLVDLIHSDIDNENLSIEELSKSMHMSRSQLHRKVKALTGFTPTLFLRNIRLKQAKQLLETGQGNVSEIAFAVGFKNSSYFSKCFKETYGILPKEVAFSE